MNKVLTSSKRTKKSIFSLQELLRPSKLIERESRAHAHGTYLRHRIRILAIVLQTTVLSLSPTASFRVLGPITGPY